MRSEFLQLSSTRRAIWCSKSPLASSILRTIRPHIVTYNATTNCSLPASSTSWTYASKTSSEKPSKDILIPSRLTSQEHLIRLYTTGLLKHIFHPAFTILRTKRIRTEIRMTRSTTINARRHKAALYVVLQSILSGAFVQMNTTARRFILTSVIFQKGIASPSAVNYKHSAIAMMDAICATR